MSLLLFHTLGINAYINIVAMTLLFQCYQDIFVRVFNQFIAFLTV